MAGTGNPVPSDAIADLKANAETLDQFVSSAVLSATTRTGKQIKTIQSVIEDATNAIQSTGWFIVGNFADGFTFTAYNQVGRDASGEMWSYNGSLPFSVAAGTVPSEPDYTNRGDAALRSELADADSSVLVGGVPADRLAKSYSGITIKDVSGASSVNLLRSEVSANVIVLTGALAGDIEVAFPTLARQWTVVNETSGDFKLSIKVTGGTPIFLAPDVTMFVRSDGTNLTASTYRQQLGRVTGGTVNPNNPNVISGHPDNFISPDVHSSVISGGGGDNSENVIGGLTSTVGDSVASNVDPNGVLGTNARYSSIGGGYDNVNNAIASHITGAHCYINVAADHGTIAGGSYHAITAGSYSTILGGTRNTASSTNGYATIAGGGDNVASGERSAIGGGQGNTASGGFSAIAGGNGNSASGLFSAAISGSGNSAEQDRSVILGGNNNTTSASAGQRWGSVLSGANNLVQGEGAAVTHGRYNTAVKDWSRASGYQAVAKLPGQEAHAAGRFATDGDAQYSDNIMKRTTTDATVTNLLFEDSTTEISTTPSIAMHYRIKVVAHRTDVQGENALIILEGLAHRAATGVWTIDGKTPEKFGVAAWDATLFTSGAALRLSVTGEAGKTIQWVAKVELIENIG